MSGWERLSAQPGGTVAGFARDGKGRVFAATMAGVYQSVDTGSSWTPASRHQSVPFCEVIASEGSRLYGGSRNGLYRSEDGGASWRQLLSGGQVLSLALTGGLVMVGTESDGILRSEDGGRTFSGANAGLPDSTILALALSPDFERDGTGFAGTPTGVYRTRNAGQSWRAMDLDAEVQCLWLTPRFAEDQLVLAGTESAGLFRSDDAGARWERVRALDASGVSAVASSGKGTLAAATDVGIAISDDADSWRITTVPNGLVLALDFVPSAAGEILLAGLQHSGIARAAAPYRDWTLSTSGLQARLVLSLAFSPAFAQDQAVFAAGPDVGVIVSNDAGRSWTTCFQEPDAAPVFSVAVSPDGSVFAATDAGVYRSADRGATWQRVEATAATTIIADGSSRLLAISTGGDLLLSNDQGTSWRVLTGTFTAGLSSAATAADGTLVAITRKDDELTLWRSVTDGLEWQRYLVERGESAVALAVSPGYAVDQRVYVGQGSRVLTPIPHTREVRSGEDRPLWRSVELRAAIAALATPADPAHARAVYAATSAGVYVSHDAGEHFSDWRDGAAPTATVAVAVSPNFSQDRRVYALELGGTLWSREDASVSS